PSGTADPPGRALSATPHRTAVPDPQVRVPLAAASGLWLGRIAVFAADHTGTTGVSGDLDGQAAIWDLVTGEPILRWPCGSAVTPAMPLYAVFGGALGQVGYVRLPVDR